VSPLGLTPLQYEQATQIARLQTQVSVLSARNRWLRARLRALQRPAESWPDPVQPTVAHLWEGLDSFGMQRCTGCGLLSRTPDQVTQPCADVRRRSQRSANHAAAWVKRKERT